jgi:BASS family bile acid:Na+ symporter
MTARLGLLSVVNDFLHHQLLKLIVLSYALAALFPAVGLWIKDAEIVNIAVDGQRLTMTLPKFLLSLLIFNAGLRVRVERIRQVACRPGMMLGGLATNLLVPLLFLIIMVPAVRSWHNPDEAAIVLVGLALVTSMPIAGSSTGWAQAAGGDMALSLGLVLGSTLLSPLTTPGCLRLLGSIAPGRYGEELDRMADGGTGVFLSSWVLLPSLLGIAARRAMGENRAGFCERWSKLMSALSLPVLCYANASSCLPGVFRQPDWDFLGIILVFAVGLCVLAFTAGYFLGRLVSADRGQLASLMFGLGMNNNGSSLVLASTALSSQPMVILPIIVYNLTQHLVAALVDAMLKRLDMHRLPQPLAGGFHDGL